MMKNTAVSVTKKHWFSFSLIAVAALTAADTTETVANAGRWLKAHGGPDATIFSIFILSGCLLDGKQIRSGIGDLSSIAAALLTIMVAAPVIAALISFLPMDTGIKIGLFLVAVMPTTLSSGVVMTGIAGGSTANALVITVLSNSLSVLTIPYALSRLLPLVGESTVVVIDQGAIILKLTALVLVPLIIGLLAGVLVRRHPERRPAVFLRFIPLINQGLILAMVWMALSSTRETLIDSGRIMGGIGLLCFTYHGLLLVSALLTGKLFGLTTGRIESVIFMGAQKTLTLSVILQVSLFPQYGIALGVCVLHHIIHMLMDGILAGKMSGHPG